MIPWISFSSYEEYFALWMITTNTLINLQLRYYINLFIILNILLNIFLWNLIYFSSTCTEPWTFCSYLSLNLCAHILWFDIGSALLNQSHLDFHWLLSSVFSPWEQSCWYLSSKRLFPASVRVRVHVSSVSKMRQIKTPRSGLWEPCDCMRQFMAWSFIKEAFVLWLMLAFRWNSVQMCNIRLFFFLVFLMWKWLITAHRSCRETRCVYRVSWSKIVVTSW